MGPSVTSGLCMNGMNKPLATVDAVKSERVKMGYPFFGITFYRATYRVAN